MQLNRIEITERLKDILLMAGDNNPAAIENSTEDTKLVTDLGLSSVGMLYLVIAVEEAFSIRFENVGMSDFQTVKDVVDYIEGALK